MIPLPRKKRVPPLKWNLPPSQGKRPTGRPLKESQKSSYLDKSTDESDLEDDDSEKLSELRIIGSGNILIKMNLLLVISL